MFRYIIERIRAGRQLKKDLKEFKNTPVTAGKGPINIVDFNTLYQKVVVDGDYYGQLSQRLITNHDMLHMGP